METIADKSEWVEDAALGVAVREVGGELQVKAITCDGAHNLDDAMSAAYGLDDYPDSYPVGSHQSYIWRIDASHRLAFARALAPIECEVKAVQA